MVYEGARSVYGPLLGALGASAVTVGLVSGAGEAAALGVGAAYDRHGAKVLYVVPPLVALVPPLALAGRLPLALAGLVGWGIAVGVQDSTIKTLVAELVEPARRATAYGVFAGIHGVLAIAGGLLIGWLYEKSLTAVVVTVALLQVLALVILVMSLGDACRRSRPAGVP
ncbi:conserved membrane hypothetical protein [Nostocoides australiense Ben110]|uniref:Major facilitator superfamily MFS_1 n=1 Tax=Nostocoides australiense Ben110 TaxID=1193182 RepID=W6JZB0_9MICO|nr:conserved membrane hypothetical protein [Tetrasphaera australiensis Ben110]